MNRLSQISNNLLITDLKDLVAQEREMLLEILRYLKVVENRQLYLKMGYPSQFAFLTEALSYSEGAAQRRIQTMRLMKALPEVESKIESGEISLSVASQVQGFIQREDKRRKIEKSPLLQPTEKHKLLNQLEGTSSRECERQLVKISPEAAMPLEKTKPLSESKTLIQFVANSELMNKNQRLKSLTSHTNPEGKYEELFNKLTELALDKLDPERRVERREKRKKQKSAKQHPSTPNPSLKELPYADHLKAQRKSPNTKKSPRAWAPCGARALGGSLKRKVPDLPTCSRSQQQVPTPPPTPAVEKELSKTVLLTKKAAKQAQVPLKGLGPSSNKTPMTSENINNHEQLAKKKNKNSPPTSAVQRTRHIPTQLKDRIYQRDHGKCQYQAPQSHKSCGSTYFLELDHRYPFSLGGEHSEKNLRLLCKSHNLYGSELIR